MHVCICVCTCICVYADIGANVCLCKENLYEWMYAIMYVGTYVMCVCMYVSMYVCTSIRAYVCLYGWVCLCKYIFMHACMYACMHVCVGLYVRKSVYMHVSIHIYICLYFFYVFACCWYMYVYMWRLRPPNRCKISIPGIIFPAEVFRYLWNLNSIKALERPGCRRALPNLRAWALPVSAAGVSAGLPRLVLRILGFLICLLCGCACMCNGELDGVAFKIGGHWGPESGAAGFGLLGLMFVLVRAGAATTLWSTLVLLATIVITIITCRQHHR